MTKKNPGKPVLPCLWRVMRRSAVRSIRQPRETGFPLYCKEDQSLVACLNFIRAIKPPALLLNTENVPPMR